MNNQYIYQRIKSLMGCTQGNKGKPPIPQQHHNPSPNHSPLNKQQVKPAPSNPQAKNINSNSNVQENPSKVESNPKAGNGLQSGLQKSNQHPSGFPLPPQLPQQLNKQHSQLSPKNNLSPNSKILSNNGSAIKQLQQSHNKSNIASSKKEGEALYNYENQEGYVNNQEYIQHLNNNKGNFVIEPIKVNESANGKATHIDNMRPQSVAVGHFKALESNVEDEQVHEDSVIEYGQTTITDSSHIEVVFHM